MKKADYLGMFILGRSGVRDERRCRLYPALERFATPTRGKRSEGGARISQNSSERHKKDRELDRDGEDRLIRKKKTVMEEMRLV